MRWFKGGTGDVFSLFFEKLRGGVRILVLREFSAVCINFMQKGVLKNVWVNLLPTPPSVFMGITVIGTLID